MVSYMVTTPLKRAFSASLLALGHWPSPVPHRRPLRLLHRSLGFELLLRRLQHAFAEIELARPGVEFLPALLEAFEQRALAGRSRPRLILGDYGSGNRLALGRPARTGGCGFSGSLGFGAGTDPVMSPG